MQRILSIGAVAILAVLAVLAVTLPASAATEAPATAIPTPAYRVVYTVSNPSPVPTGPFNLAIRVDSLTFESYLAPSLTNEIWTYTDGEPIPSWIETNATPTSVATPTWLRLDRGVAADSSMEVWLNVYPPSDLLMDPLGPSGLAPQLTDPYYGALDDGAAVFPAYDNFAGTALSPANVEYLGWGGTNLSDPVVVNDSLTTNVGKVAQNGGVWVELPEELVPPVTVDALVTAQTVPSNFGLGEFDADNGFSNGAAAPGVVYVAKTSGQSYAEGCSSDFHSGYDNNGTVAGNLLGVHSLTWNANGTLSVAENYRTTYGFSSGCIPDPAHVRVGVGHFPWASDESGTVQWIRARLLPAAGSDPAVTLAESYVPISPPGSSSGPPGASYFSIVPGTASETQGAGFDLFDVPEFVLAEPVGAPTNLSITKQVWQTLQLGLLGRSAPFENWSVSETSSGEFTLNLNLTDSLTSEIDAGNSILALTAEILIGNVTLGASGTITAAVLESATGPTNFWEEWFGIPAPPGFGSPQDVVVTLADLSGSVAGRALYMASALIGATAYLYTAHKLARDRLSGGDKATEAHRKRREATS